jgi:hypothetical protein
MGMMEIATGFSSSQILGCMTVETGGTFSKLLFDVDRLSKEHIFDDDCRARLYLAWPAAGVEQSPRLFTWSELFDKVGHDSKK